MARILAHEYRLPADAFTLVRTNAFSNAGGFGRPAATRPSFSRPATGVPHALYTTLLEDLASRGLVVIAVDHTYETEAVQFPGGSIVRRTLPADPNAKANPASYRLMLRIMARRLADVRFVVRSLTWIDHRLSRVDRSRVGVFGHSLGGLTAAAALEADRSLRAGIDLDGSIFGPGVRRPLRRPFMIMTEHGDGTTRRFWDRLRGVRLFVAIAGTRHLNFSDWNILVPRLRRAHASLPPVGTIDPARALSIQRAYVDAFFGRHLLHAATPLLDSPPPFPEVHLKR